jgi:hypothetical protein
VVKVAAAVKTTTALAAQSLTVVEVRVAAFLRVVRVGSEAAYWVYRIGLIRDCSSGLVVG